MNMLKLLDKEKTHVIVKMDIYTYETFLEKNDITCELHELENEAKINSKTYKNVDELFDDLEK